MLLVRAYTRGGLGQSPFAVATFNVQIRKLRSEEVLSACTGYRKRNTVLLGDCHQCTLSGGVF